MCRFCRISVMSIVLQMYIWVVLSLCTQVVSQDLFLSSYGALAEKPAFEGVYDFTTFEDQILPKWLKRFTVDYALGKFSYKPDGVAALYGSIDVVHVLASVGQLAQLTTKEADAWAAQINSFQNAAGLYVDDARYLTGTQPYHGAGEATASLALLGRQSRYNNSIFISLAKSSPAVWKAFYDSFYHGTNKSIHCSSIHGCGQVIGSIPSVLAYTTGKEHADFINWWLDWIAERTDVASGTLCPLDNMRTLYDCLGGGMATHGIQLGLRGSGYEASLANPGALLNFSLSLQCDDGTWCDSGKGKLGSMSLDGIFQVTRSSLQLQNSRWREVKASCSFLLRESAAQMNDEDTMIKHYWECSHNLPNVVAAVAECAQLFPEMVKTRHPWSCCARYV